MSTKKSFKLVNMTSTQIFKNQAENIFRKLRFENDADSDSEVYFAPLHMGGAPGQRKILVSKSIMREIKVEN